LIGGVAAYCAALAGATQKHEATTITIGARDSCLKLIRPRLTECQRISLEPTMRSRD
jgi:hypothetical protein